MAVFTPDLPWLYLLAYGAFMVFIITFGIIMQLTVGRKKKQKELEAKKAETVEE